MANPENPRQTFAATTSRKWLDMPPAADALSQVKDGHPMDAGTWMIVQQNINVALDVAPRQLVQSAPGGGLTTITQPTAGGWSALFEHFLSTAERTDAITDVSWSTRDGGGAITAERHGPFVAIRDRVGSDNSSGLYRYIRAHAYVESSSANHFSVGFAVTPGEQPPTEGYLYWSTWTANDTATFKLITHRAQISDTGTLTMPNGITTTVGGVARLDTFYLWWGFKHDGTGTHKVHSLSAYEWLGGA